MRILWWKHISLYVKSSYSKYRTTFSLKSFRQKRACKLKMNSISNQKTPQTQTIKVLYMKITWTVTNLHLPYKNSFLEIPRLRVQTLTKATMHVSDDYAIITLSSHHRFFLQTLLHSYSLQISLSKELPHCHISTGLPKFHLFLS